MAVKKTTGTSKQAILNNIIATKKKPFMKDATGVYWKDRNGKAVRFTSKEVSEAGGEELVRQL